jgi:hypothetical protein
MNFWTNLLETKPNSKQYEFKTHIIQVKYEDFTETNWYHEESRGKCLKQSYEVDSALTISEKIKSNDEYSFEILEFAGLY